MGSAVAIGANARATVRGSPPSPGASSMCSKCPYKKKWQKIEAMK